MSLLRTGTVVLVSVVLLVVVLEISFVRSVKRRGSLWTERRALRFFERYPDEVGVLSGVALRIAPEDLPPAFSSGILTPAVFLSPELEFPTRAPGGERIRRIPADAAPRERACTLVYMLPFSLNEWTIEPDRLLIVRGGESVRLEPKAMELLCALASRPGEVIAKGELLAMVWGDVVVEDDVLTTAMHQLRRALGDDHRAPRYVETIPRRGYRLVAPVQAAHRRAAFRRTRTVIAVSAALIVITATGLHRRADRAAALELRRLATENLVRGVDLPETVRLLRRASQLDPSDSAAGGSLALAMALSAETSAADVRQEIDRALRMDAQNRHARVAAGLFALWEDWDWAKARRDLESVAREGDPVARAWLAYVHALAGQRDAAAAQLEDIAGPPIAAAAASMTHLLLGDSTRADAVLSAALRADPENNALLRQRAKIHERRMEAAAYGGGPPAAGPVGLTTLARLHLTHGETEQALAALERAWREREHELLYLRVDRRWDSLRSEPRFRQIVAAVGP